MLTQELRSTYKQLSATTYHLQLNNSSRKIEDIKARTSKLYSTLIVKHLKSDTKTGSIVQLFLMTITLLSVASVFGYDKRNTFDVLRDMNNLSNMETFGLVFGQQICAMVAFTALEIREDLILPAEENKRRGTGTSMPRSRAYGTIYKEFPFSWAAFFSVCLSLKVPLCIFSRYDNESWGLWGIKMMLWFVTWEFMMYSFHRISHSYPLLYKWFHKGHHVVMDFPVGPHAPVGEKLSHYAASIIASKIVGLSVGSWILNLNILITQCVLEHSYSSYTLPFWHGIFAFNTADLHQTHHIRNDANFGYALNLFDPIFGTYVEPKKSPARRRFLNSRRSTVGGQRLMAALF